MRREFWIWLSSFLVGLIIVCFLISSSNKNYSSSSIFVVSEILMRGDSMAPTINAGEYVGLDFGHYKTHSITQGDIVALKFKGNEVVVNRVIALSGDKVVFNGNNIILNGKELKEDYVKNKELNPEFNFLRTQLSLYNGRVPENSLLVLGDNRPSSFDASTCGIIPKSFVIAKVEI